MYPSGGPGYPNGPSIGFNLDMNNGYGGGGGGYGGAPYPTSESSGFPNPNSSYPSQSGYPGSSSYPNSYPSSGAEAYPGPSYPGQSSYPSSSSSYPGGSSGYPSGGYGSSDYPSQPSAGYGGSSGYPSQPSGGYGQSGYGSGYGGSVEFPPHTKPAPAPYQPQPPVSGGNLYPSLPGGPSAGYGNSGGYGVPAGGYGGAGNYSGNSSGYGGSAGNYGGSAGNYGGSAGNYGGSAGGYGGAAVNYGQSFMGEPTLRPHQPFNPNDDATKLYKAMKGFGTDETTLIDILCKRTYSQRNEISLCFKTQYGKDLAKNVMDETSGNFKVLLKSLFMTPMQLQAKDIKKAVDGLGTDEADLIEILCSKSNSEMIDLKNTYRQMFNRDMERDVGGDLSGYLKRLMISLCAANRSEAPPDHQKAAQLAKELYEGGMKRMGTDEVTFNRIFASESLPQLKLTFEEYYRLTGHDIEKAVKSEMSGFVEKAFLALVSLARNPSQFYAERLHIAMKGLGTHDHDLIRIMVLRSEIDLMTVKGEFQRKYSKTLESFIKGDCSGDYKRALLCLAGDPNWR